MNRWIDESRIWRQIELSLRAAASRPAESRPGETRGKPWKVREKMDKMWTWIMCNDVDMSKQTKFRDTWMTPEVLQVVSLRGLWIVNCGDAKCRKKVEMKRDSEMSYLWRHMIRYEVSRCLKKVKLITYITYNLYQFKFKLWCFDILIALKMPVSLREGRCQCLGSLAACRSSMFIERHFQKTKSCDLDKLDLSHKQQTMLFWAQKIETIEWPRLWSISRYFPPNLKKQKKFWSNCSNSKLLEDVPEVDIAMMRTTRWVRCNGTTSVSAVCLAFELVQLRDFEMENPVSPVQKMRALQSMSHSATWYWELRCIYRSVLARQFWS